jgi:hypothetical protein
MTNISNSFKKSKASLACGLLALIVIIIFYPSLNVLPFRGFVDGSLEYLAVARYYFESADNPSLPHPPSGLFEPKLYFNPWNQYLIFIGSVYKLLGREIIAIPQFFSVLIFYLSSIYLFKLLKNNFNLLASLLGTLFFIFHPQNIIYSACIMPEPFIIFLLIASIYYLDIYIKNQTAQNFLFFSLVSSLTIFFNPKPTFSIVLSFLCLQWFESKIAIKEKLHRISILIILVFVIAAIYETLGWRYGHATFIYQLFIDKNFWHDWLNISYSFYGKFLLVPFVALLLNNSSHVKLLICSLLIGFFIFGLYFTYHIHTHFYYQLQFILVISMAIAAAYEAISNTLHNKKTLIAFIFIIISLFIFYKNYYRSDSNFYKSNFIIEKNKSKKILSNSTLLKDKVGNSDLIYYGKEGGTMMTYAGIKGARWIDIGALSGDIEAGVESKSMSKESYIAKYWKNFNRNNHYKYFISDQPDVLFKDQKILYNFLLEKCHLEEIDRSNNIIIVNISTCRNFDIIIK